MHADAHRYCVACPWRRKKVGRFSSVNKIDDHMGPKGKHPTVTLIPRTPSALLNANWSLKKGTDYLYVNDALSRYWNNGKPPSFYLKMLPKLKLGTLMIQKKVHRATGIIRQIPGLHAHTLVLILAHTIFFSRPGRAAQWGHKKGNSGDVAKQQA